MEYLQVYSSIFKFSQLERKQLNTMEQFYALCRQTDGLIEVRKLSFDKIVWFTVPKAKWPLEVHPLIEKRIQKKNELKDNGFRTAVVPLVVGRNKTPSEAAAAYVNQNGQFVIEGVPLEPDDLNSNAADINDANASASLIMQKLGM